MKRQTIVLLMSFFVLYSCSTNTEKEIAYQIEKDTLVDVPKYVYSGLYEDDTALFFYCKPYECDSLLLYKKGATNWDFFDFLKIPEVFANSKNLDKAITKWVLVNQDTIIAYEFHKQITFLDVKNNDVITTFALENEEKKYSLEHRCFQQFQWNKTNQSLPFMYFSWGNSNRKYNGDVEIIAEYSLNKGLTVFPLKYPYEVYDTYIAKYPYCDPIVVYHGDTIVVAFNHSPMVLCYDVKTQKVDSMYIKNKHFKKLPQLDTTGLSEISVPNFIEMTYLLNFYFEYLLYDFHKETYYRFFSQDMPLKNEDGLFNTMNDKVFGVTLIDKNFNIIGDVLFKPTEYRLNYYPTSEGLWAIDRDKDKDKVIISKLTFDYE